MIILRSLIFQAGMWLFTIPFTIICLFLFPFKPITRYKIISLWAKTMLWWVKITCNLSFTVSGIEYIPDKPFMILSKHQSAWETLAFQKIFPPQVWVLKRELLWIPFFGWGLAMTSPIAINRSAGRKALEQMKIQGIDRVKKGFNIVIFPEGTRMKPGETGKYHIGGAWLAHQLKLDIIPVAHNAGNYWKKNSFLREAGVIKVVIGKPINSTTEDPGSLNQKVKEWIETTMTDINV